MLISYNWLKWYIPEAPTADKLADIITYHIAEVESVQHRVLNKEEDWIFDIKILPNRAHDLLSHQGVARELASLLNITYADSTPKYKIPESKATELKIKITTVKDRRHMARIVRNVKVGPSPEWVVSHLVSIGQRSINNIVDATNITMFDCGQPTHAFDMNRVRGLSLNIQDAKSGQKITLLTGEEKELNDSMIVISDGEGNPLDTGIKGGKYAEITTSTTDIILEADNFDPVFARKTGQALNIFTDARKRFENDLSPELIPYAMKELSALIMEMCPEAIFEEIVDTYPQKQKERKLYFSVERISKILGLDVSVAEVEDILKRYNFDFSPPDKGDLEGLFEIIVPPMRLDLIREEDMAEEIGRILGYDKVKPKIPKINFKPKQNETYSKIFWVRNKLLEDGYSEVMNTSFTTKGEVSVLASASDKNFLRTNLSDGLKESLKLNKINAPFLGLEEIKIFEIGTVFKKNGEEMRVAYGNNKNISEVSLSDFCNDIPSDFKPEPISYNLEDKFTMWSRFPFVLRDIAIRTPNSIKREEIEDFIKNNTSRRVVRSQVFDEFQVSSLDSSTATHLVFQSDETTLTDDEVNEEMEKLNKEVKKRGWEVR